MLKRVGFDGELTSTILRPDKVARYRYFSTIVSVAVLSFCLKSKSYILLPISILPSSFISVGSDTSTTNTVLLEIA